MKLTAIALFLLIFQTVVSQERIVEEFPEVFVRAAEEQKSVIFIFDHPNCGWCVVFDNYHASPEVKEILDPEYLIHKIDISDSDSAMSLFEHYNFRGVPTWMIYSSNKELFTDGYYENGFYEGYPDGPEGSAMYQDAISKTSRHIKKKQLRLLGEKLEYFGKE